MLYVKRVLVIGLTAFLPGIGWANGACHDADINESWTIEIGELSRLVGFYNAEGYQCDAGTPDGYAPFAGDQTCGPHDSDYNPEDWRISIVEISRLVGFYNAGAYSVNPDTPDGFQPGEPQGTEVIGEQGGTITSEAGADVVIPSGGLNQEVRFQVTDTQESAIRESLAEEVPYASALTIDATPLKQPAKTDPANPGFEMTVTLPLAAPLDPGIELDVYRQGEFENEWVLLDAPATVDAGGATATFVTPQPGTFIVRQEDAYSIPTLDYDSLPEPPAKVDKDFAPALGFGLHRIDEAGSADRIPVILIHGVNSHTYTQEAGHAAEPGRIYARWDKLIAWALGADGSPRTADDGLDLDRYDLWWFLHNSFLPVGFDPYAVYPGDPPPPNNARQLMEAIEAARAEGRFPDATRQFIIVAHSRGGLVTRAFMQGVLYENGGCPEVGGDQVLVALTLATPHHGSPLGVPDWTFHTIKRYYSLPILDLALPEQVTVWQSVKWWLPGYADLAWDNFDVLNQDRFGIPERWVYLSTWLNEILTPLHQVTSNDAGWPTNATVDDLTMPVPDIYVLEDGHTRGRKPGQTLHDLNTAPEANAYLRKFILYGGYLREPLWHKSNRSVTGRKGYWGDLIDHSGLALVDTLMTCCESNGQVVSLFAANDGLVPLQSAFCLNASASEPIYATYGEFGEKVTYPIQINRPAIDARLRLPYERHAKIFEDYDHLDMVEGKPADHVLFENIERNLDSSVESRPTASFTLTKSKDGRSVALDASESTDNHTEYWPATALAYRVDWGEDAPELAWTSWNVSPLFQHDYPTQAAHVVTLQVRDQDGMIDTVRNVREVYVSLTTGNDETGCGTIDNPWASISHAVEQAPGAETLPVNIHVAAGTYVENVALGAYQSLLGGYSVDFSQRVYQTPEDRQNALYATIIDGSSDPARRVVTLYNYTLHNYTAVLSGFIIQNGQNGGVEGGGMDSIVAHNTITNNSAWGGGGLYDCYGTISNNTIAGNSATYDGGGLGACGGTISNNTITGNSAADGGGLYGCDGTISNNTITGNSATGQYGSGGGLEWCDGTISNNTITGNSATYCGGGLEWCDGTIEGNTVSNNSADGLGGGVENCDGMITNNTITNNSAWWGGGGLYGCDGTISNNTISGNSTGDEGGGGGLCSCYGSISNNTITGNWAWGGGGLAFCDGTVSDNTITGNSAEFHGGGLYECCSATLSGNTISGNTSAGCNNFYCQRYPDDICW